MKVKEAMVMQAALTNLLRVKMKGTTAQKIGKLSIKFDSEADQARKNNKKIIDDSKIGKHINAQGMLAVDEELNELELAKVKKTFDKVCEETAAIGETKAEVKVSKSNKFSIDDLVFWNGDEYIPIDIEPGILKILDPLMTD